MTTILDLNHLLGEHTNHLILSTKKIIPTSNYVTFDNSIPSVFKIPNCFCCQKYIYHAYQFDNLYIRFRRVCDNHKCCKIIDYSIPDFVDMNVHISDNTPCCNNSISCCNVKIKDDLGRVIFDSNRDECEPMRIIFPNGRVETFSRDEDGKKFKVRIISDNIKIIIYDY